MTAGANFVLAARNALSFLENEYGFRLTEIVAPPEFDKISCLYKVTYRKQSSCGREQFVSLATAPARLEQYLEAGRNWPPDYSNTFDVFELLAIVSPKSRIEFTSGVYEGFGDLEQMTDQYGILASILRNRGARYFADDPSLWDAVRQQRELMIQKGQIEEASRAAEKAFKDRDWKRTIELLEGLGKNRTALQTARLAYAHKQLSN